MQGFGFITFANSREVAAATAAGEYHVHGKLVRVNPAGPRPMGPATTATPPEAAAPTVVAASEQPAATGEAHAGASEAGPAAAPGALRDTPLK